MPKIWGTLDYNIKLELASNSSSTSTKAKCVQLESLNQQVCWDSWVLWWRTSGLRWRWSLVRALCSFRKTRAVRGWLKFESRRLVTADFSRASLFISDSSFCVLWFGFHITPPIQLSHIQKWPFPGDICQHSSSLTFH